MPAKHVADPNRGMPSVTPAVSVTGRFTHRRKAGNRGGNGAGGRVGVAGAAQTGDGWCRRALGLVILRHLTPALAHHVNFREIRVMTGSAMRSLSPAFWRQRFH